MRSDHFTSDFSTGWRQRVAAFVLAAACSGCGTDATAQTLDPKVIEAAAGTAATLSTDGVVRIGWSRNDVDVTVDGMAFPPAAGLGSWAAFTETDHGVMVMGDNVVFRDEVDAVIDAAFAHGLEITALHNHFFYDEPIVYFMHVGGQGEPAALARGVKAMWDAARAIRRETPEPADRFGGPIPQPGEGRIDPGPIEQIIGADATVNAGGVVKVTLGREARMHGKDFGASMGLTTWAALSGSDELAAMDGDFAMRAEEVTPVLRALRQADIHVVALHNHMMGETPAYYFVHFWGVGSTKTLAAGFKSALDAQAQVGLAATRTHRWDFDDVEIGAIPDGWRIEGTNQRGALAEWSVQARSDAPSSPNALVLSDPKDNTGSTFNLSWTDTVELSDGVIEVSVKADSGREDQGGGPIWRVQDKDNYYIARWNPLEDNFRLYTVKQGSRKMIESAKVEVDPKAWHQIRVEHHGDEIRCFFDGRALFTARDSTFSEPGGVGVWTKADAATSFDDFIAAPRETGTGQ
ncbi:MAG: DUF1259 domain-containing protein [Gammaproteobacteria bacterium]